MDRRRRSTLNLQIYEEACEWFIESRQGELGEAARRSLDRWLRQSPEHLSAYLEVAVIWNQGPALDPQHQWDAETLIAHAVTEPQNVAALSASLLRPGPGDSPGGRKLTQAPRAPSRWRPFAVAAGLAVVALAGGLMLWSQVLRLPTYTTAIGEQRSIVLADGSTIELNSRSAVQLRYTDEERAVELLEGQALFQVAKDPARPFVVESDGTRVRAVGTQFDVYKKSTGTLVTVVEGRVAVLTQTGRTQRPDSTSVSRRPSEQIPVSGQAVGGDESDGTAIAVDGEWRLAGQGGEGAILLAAGEQLSVMDQGVRKVEHADIAGATAWRQRQIVFVSASLAEVAEEFNRYNERQLVVSDRGQFDFHISGVFSSTDPASLIRFLNERPGVHIVEKGSEIRVEKVADAGVTDRK